MQGGAAGKPLVKAGGSSPDWAAAAQAQWRRPMPFKRTGSDVSDAGDRFRRTGASGLGGLRSCSRNELHHREDPDRRQDAAGEAAGARCGRRVAGGSVGGAAPAGGRYAGGGDGASGPGQAERRAPCPQVLGCWRVEGEVMWDLSLECIPDLGAWGPGGGGGGRAAAVRPFCGIGAEDAAL